MIQDMVIGTTELNQNSDLKYKLYKSYTIVKEPY